MHHKKSSRPIFLLPHRPFSDSLSSVSLFFFYFFFCCNKHPPYLVYLHYAPHEPLHRQICSHSSVFSPILKESKNKKRLPFFLILCVVKSHIVCEKASSIYQKFSYHFRPFWNCLKFRTLGSSFLVKNVSFNFPNYRPYVCQSWRCDPILQPLMRPCWRSQLQCVPFAAPAGVALMLP